MPRDLHRHAAKLLASRQAQVSSPAFASSAFSLRKHVRVTHGILEVEKEAWVNSFQPGLGCAAGTSTAETCALKQHLFDKWFGLKKLRSMQCKPQTSLTSQREIRK